MAKMYAWSNFPVEYNEWGQPTKTIAAGDSISQSDLGVSDEEWEDLIATGAVREEEYPDIPPEVSPAEYQKQVDNATVQVEEAQLVLSTAAQTKVENAQEDAAPKATQTPAAGKAKE